MGLNLKKKLVCGTVLVCIWNVGVKVKAAQSQTQTSPYLSLKFRGVSDQKGKSASDAVTLKRAERLDFQIQYVTHVPYRATRGVHYSPLSIRAINQHPDFFKERPGPTVSLEIRRAGRNGGELLPVRVFSSGEGYGGGVHYLPVLIDILEPEAARRERLRQFVNQLREAAQSSGFPTSEPMSDSGRWQTGPFDGLYISNPVGVYLLKATFHPDLSDLQRVLTAAVYVKVLDGPDSLDLIKKKLSQKK